MEKVINQLETFLYSEGIAEIGYADVTEHLRSDLLHVPTAVAIVMPLLHGVVDTITDQPSFTYFQHYRTVNSHIDRCMLLAASIIEKSGYLAIPVPASQTVVRDNLHEGIFPHKTAAVLAGLGTIGKNALFISNSKGCYVRLGTILTNIPIECKNAVTSSKCNGCNACANACPAGAITGAKWHEGITREAIIDVVKCAKYMRDNYMHIGRGSVCGICMRVCPHKG